MVTKIWKAWINVKSCLGLEELWADVFYVLISFVVSNIVLITSKIYKMVKITFEKLNA